MRWAVMALVAGASLLSGMTCAPQTAMAKPGRMAVYEPGSAPKRPVQVLAELSEEVVDEKNPAAAMEALRRKARALGADALTEVRLVEEPRKLPLSDAMTVPLVLLGSMVSVLSGNPAALHRTADAVNGPTPPRRIMVMRAVAVRYVGK
ncbi:MAG: hypothetical protein AB2A00_34920 [Myxococcota bacterium]